MEWQQKGADFRSCRTSKAIKPAALAKEPCQDGDCCSRNHPEAADNIHQGLTTRDFVEFDLEERISVTRHHTCMPVEEARLVTGWKSLQRTRATQPVLTVRGCLKRLWRLRQRTVWFSDPVTPRHSERRDEICHAMTTRGTK